MSYELVHMPGMSEPSHDSCGDCIEPIKGFSSIREAAIYAYDNCRCNLCKSHENTLRMDRNELDLYISNIAQELGDDVAKETAEFIEFERNEVDLNDKADIWNYCLCSNEWMIFEEEDSNS